MFDLIAKITTGGGYHLTRAIITEAHLPRRWHSSSGELAAREVYGPLVRPRRRSSGHVPTCRDPSSTGPPSLHQRRIVVAARTYIGHRKHDERRRVVVYTFSSSRAKFLFARSIADDSREGEREREKTLIDPGSSIPRCGLCVPLVNPFDGAQVYLPRATSV